jgi:glycerate kinase
MRVLCAPDAFKGTLDANAAAAAMAKGVRAAGHEAIAMPVADGGEGTVNVLLHALGGTLQHAPCIDPTGRAMEAPYGLLSDGAAIIECAAAGGLPLLSAAERQPLTLTCAGTGQLLVHATEQGANNLLLGIGGTATVDGGAGLLQSLGAILLDASETPLPTPVRPVDLAALHSVRLPEHPPALKGLIDTKAPLLGTQGAARVFGPQKGASPEQVVELESVLNHVASIIDPSGTLHTIHGAGAGGGIGFAVLALGGTLAPGADVVLDAIGIDGALQQADLVLTGEGCIDAQTAQGKAPFIVAQRAAQAGVRCIGIAGMAGDGHAALVDDGPFETIESLIDRFGVEMSMGDPAGALGKAVADLLHTC